MTQESAAEVHGDRDILPGTLGEVYARNQRLYRAFLLYHQLRLLFALRAPTLAPTHLDAWMRWAARSKLAPFLKAARTLRAHRDGHARRHPPRPVQRPPRGPQQPRAPHQPPQLRIPFPRPTIALIYLCCGGVTIDLSDAMSQSLRCPKHRKPAAQSAIDGSPGSAGVTFVAPRRLPTRAAPMGSRWVTTPARR